MDIQIQIRFAKKIIIGSTIIEHAEDIKMSVPYDEAKFEYYINDDVSVLSKSKSESDSALDRELPHPRKFDKKKSSGAYYDVRKKHLDDDLDYYMKSLENSSESSVLEPEPGPEVKPESKPEVKPESKPEVKPTPCIIESEINAYLKSLPGMNQSGIIPRGKSLPGMNQSGIIPYPAGEIPPRDEPERRKSILPQ